MSRVERIRVEFVEFIPGTPESGVLYVSRKYQTATHLCCCGCGNRVVTPLKPGGWRLITKRETVTLYPSIGSWSLPCKSHYWIRANRIEWAPQWSQSQIDAARRLDQRAREEYFDSPPPTVWERIMKWLKGDVREESGQNRDVP